MTKTYIPPITIDKEIKTRERVMDKIIQSKITLSNKKDENRLIYIDEEDDHNIVFHMSREGFIEIYNNSMPEKYKIKHISYSGAFSYTDEFIFMGNTYYMYDVFGNISPEELKKKIIYITKRIEEEAEQYNYNKFNKKEVIKLFNKNYKEQMKKIIIKGIEQRDILTRGVMFCECCNQKTTDANLEKKELTREKKIIKILIEKYKLDK